MIEELSWFCKNWDRQIFDLTKFKSVFKCTMYLQESFMSLQCYRCNNVEHA